jgi:hypothetical protein
VLFVVDLLIFRERVASAVRDAQTAEAQGIAQPEIESRPAGYNTRLAKLK